MGGAIFLSRHSCLSPGEKSTELKQFIELSTMFQIFFSLRLVFKERGSTVFRCQLGKVDDSSFMLTAIIIVPCLRHRGTNTMTMYCLVNLPLFQSHKEQRFGSDCNPPSSVGLVGGK